MRDGCIEVVNIDENPRNLELKKVSQGLLLGVNWKNVALCRRSIIFNSTA